MSYVVNIHCETLADVRDLLDNDADAYAVSRLNEATGKLEHVTDEVIRDYALDIAVEQIELGRDPEAALDRHPWWRDVAADYRAALIVDAQTIVDERTEQDRQDRADWRAAVL